LSITLSLSLSKSIDAKWFPMVLVYASTATIYRTVPVIGTDNQTERISAIGSQIKSEWEVDDSSHNRLCDVVSQTHFSVKAQVGNGFLELSLLIK